MISTLADILDKFPFGLVVFFYLSYLGWDQYQFTEGDGSDLAMKKVELRDTKLKLDQLRKKNATLIEFVKNVEKKKAELQTLADELQVVKDAIPEKVGTTAMMRTLYIEAKRSGLGIEEVTPSSESRKEYYAEHPMSLRISGTYHQYLSLLQRLNQLSQIVQIDNFDLQLSKDSSLKAGKLNSNMSLKFYTYLGSQADLIIKASGSGAQGAGNRPAGAVKVGAQGVQQ